MALYLILGPIAGLLIFAIGMSILAEVSAPAGFWIGPFILIYGWIFAHFVGGLWAFIAGAIAAIWALSIRRPASFIGPMGGVASFALALSTGNVALLYDSVPSINQNTTLPDIGFLLVMLATFSLSSTACWAIARRF